MWKELHTQYLRDHLISTLDRFDGFMEQVKVGLDLPVDDGDLGKQNLRKVMKDILEVGKAEVVTMEMFDPLRELCTLLKHHACDITNEVIPSVVELRRRAEILEGDAYNPEHTPDTSASKAVLDYLEEAPINWEAIVKIKYAKKDEIAPIKEGRQESSSSSTRRCATSAATSAPTRFAHQGFAEEDAMMDVSAPVFEQSAKEFNAQEVFELEYVKHKDTAQNGEMSIIKLSEEVIEALDAHMLELQTMLGMGKFVEFFRAGVEDWQVKLSNVQVTIKVWESVSRSWASLESIFLSSADIRSSSRT
ncbi:dynein light chain binding protein [Aureococcus anophagefferens]|nr:dynein light chain binding protein [Aureococcus anophagefferens]